MTSYPSLKRWLAAGLTAGVLTAVLVVASWNATSQTDAGAKGGSQSWVMFGGSPSRNMINDEAKGLPVEWDISTNENVRWVANLGSKAYGGPIVSGGRVFIGTNNEAPRDPKFKLDMGVVMSFDEKNGKFLWQMLFSKLPAGRVVDWPKEGICSTPVVEGSRLYFVSNQCKVVCADTNTGKAIWETDMIKELGVFPHNIAACSPALVGDHLWLVTANGVNEDHITVPAPQAPSFIKVDKRTGKVLWQDNRPTASLLRIGEKKGSDDAQKSFLKSLVNRGELIQHGQWSNPAYGEAGGQKQVIFPGGDGWIYSYDTDGKLIWKFDCNPKDSKYELSGKGTRSDFIATPVVYKGRVYIGVGQDPEHETGVGHLWCIDMTKGKNGADVSPELVTDNTVWPPKTKKNPNDATIWHYGGTITDAKERAKLRRNNYFGRTMSTCAIKDGLLYVGEILGVLHCLDAETGKAYWSHDTRAPIWGSAYVADGKVYLGTNDGTVWVFAQGKQKKILAQNDMGTAVAATPAAANGTLFVMTANKIYAIAAGAGKK